MVDLTTFREQLGIADHEYKLMSDFKKRVLELAVKEINEKTDITVQYEQHKAGRIIKGFSFLFKQKQRSPKQKSENDYSKDLNVGDIFHKLTEKQLDMFSSKLADLPAVQTMAHVGEDMKQFVARLRSMLMDAVQQKILLPYLKEVGYTAA